MDKHKTNESVELDKFEMEKKKTPIELIMPVPIAADFMERLGAAIAHNFKKTKKKRASQKLSRRRNRG